MALLTSLPLLHQGKVRDVYDAGDGLLLMVASDRLSAFDVVMAEPVPGKGRVLTALSAFWFEHLATVAASHLVSVTAADLPVAEHELAAVTGRSMLVRRAEMLPIECIVRGRLSGSAWKEYAALGTVHGVRLPAGLRESDPLPEPMFTPSTKAASGEHDENITIARAADLVGVERLDAAIAMSLDVFTAGAERAEAVGLVLADTKLELGIVDGELVVADEVLTPDSSRWWQASSIVPGATPPSFDKQPVRDHLDALGWDHRPPPPPLAAEVIAATRARYVEAYERLAQRPFSEWPGADP